MSIHGVDDVAVTIAQPASEATMSRLEKMRARRLAIRQACLERREPPITTTALVVLRQVTGADALRLYQLAETVVFEMYRFGISEHDAAVNVAAAWRETQRDFIETTGAPVIPLAESGGYPPLVPPFVTSP